MRTWAVEISRKLLIKTDGGIPSESQIVRIIHKLNGDGVAIVEGKFGKPQPFQIGFTEKKVES